MEKVGATTPLYLSLYTYIPLVQNFKNMSMYILAPNQKKLVSLQQGYNSAKYIYNNTENRVKTESCHKKSIIPCDYTRSCVYIGTDTFIYENFSSATDVTTHHISRLFLQPPFWVLFLHQSHL